MQTNNQKLAELLRSVAAALTLQKKNLFKIKAYGNAADAIEHLTSDIKDLWEEKRLDEVPGLGDNLTSYIDEYFKTGHVKHFESLLKAFPKVTFEMLNIPGVGPQTALKLTELGVTSLGDLKTKLENGQLIKKGFSETIAPKILAGLAETKQQSGRMLISTATEMADKIISYLKANPKVKQAHALGSLRRQVSTIGDLDFSASADDPELIVDYFIKMPEISRVIDQGTNKAMVMLHNGLHVDLLVGKPEVYGALLNHFTGSKHHNIKLRSYAEKHGFSLSEFGVKDLKTDKILPAKTEKDLYDYLKMATPEPEIREDNGEIEAALKHTLPDLVKLEDLKGDLHIHSNFVLEPSHGPGINSIEEILEQAKKLGYSYVGIADHPPAMSTHSPTEMAKLIEKRTKYIQNMKKDNKSVHVLNGLEIDILGDGSLSVPDEVLETLDYCIAGIHSGHRGDGSTLTNRIIKALENPQVDIISHPTGRLIDKRPSFDADWDKIFETAAKFNKVLEINGSPERLDLRDDLVRSAIKYGVMLIIGSDAHQVESMANLKYGVSVARRGWAEKKDILNSLSLQKLADWFKIKL